MLSDTALITIRSDKSQIPSFQNNRQLVDSYNLSDGEKAKDESLTMKSQATRSCSTFSFLAAIICGTVICILFMARVDWHSCRDIFEDAPLIDGHNDFAIWIRAFYQNHIYQENFTQVPELFGQVDFPRLRQGRLRGQFWSVYVECPRESGNYNDAVYREIVHDTLQQIDLVYRLMKAYPEDLKPASTASSIRETFQSTSNIASLMGIEGLHQIGNSASILRMYYNLGVRYATLTHTCHNAYADSEEPLDPLHGGLSEAGEKLVKEMNRMGMIVDLSHTSFATQRAVLRVSRAPVIFSHSNAYALYNHTRNAPDDILRLLAERDGVIMITFYPSFLAHDGHQASLRMVADHIEYVGNLIGYRHVGLGSDFDGMGAGPKGLEDVSKYPGLIKELERRGVKKADLMGIMGRNVLRVLEVVEMISFEMKDVLPLEDNVKPFFGV